MVRKTLLPDAALLAEYRRSGDYTDCYSVDLDRRISFARYVEAFYTTCLFKLERGILRIAVSRPSTDDDASRVANARSDFFAAWEVEARTENELLMCDFQGHTRSWFMTESLQSDGREITRLYFGSAVVARRDAQTGERNMATGFRLLLTFHKLYSRALLWSAKVRLRRLSH